MSDTKTTTGRGRSDTGSTNVWSDEERAAMRASARERKTSSRRDPAEERAAAERDFQESVAKLPEPDHSMAERVHAIVMAAVPDLETKTYYGMPAWTKNGNTICWFKNASKFKMRYQTLEFSDKAHLDDGAMWPASYAIMELTGAAETKIADLVRRAAG